MMGVMVVMMMMMVVAVVVVGVEEPMYSFFSTFEIRYTPPFFNFSLTIKKLR